MESSCVKFSNGFLFLDGLDSVELGLALGTSLETTDGSSKFLVVVKVVSESSAQVIQFRFVLK